MNLSGRNNNPFAASQGSRSSTTPQSTQNTLAQAQQERILRQQERERPPAATRIQKTWRGYKRRKEAKHDWTYEWDSGEVLVEGGSFDKPYASEADCLRQLRLLVQFVSPRLQEDIQRLHHFAHRYLLSVQSFRSACPSNEWIYPLLRLVKITLATLKTERHPPLNPDAVNDFLELLQTLSTAIPGQVSVYSSDYYKALAEIGVSQVRATPPTLKPRCLEKTILALVGPLTSETNNVYESLAYEFLVTPELPFILGSLDRLASALNYTSLAAALNNLLSPTSQRNVLKNKSSQQLLWLLAYFIYIRRQAHGKQEPLSGTRDVPYVKIISRLISFLADEIGARIDIPESQSRKVNEDPASRQHLPLPIPKFVRSEISTLVNRESVSGLLAHIEVDISSTKGSSESSELASFLASYALTLMRAFPSRGDEIRLWLYLGSTSRRSNMITQGSKRLPAIKFFYQAASGTSVYDRIQKDPHEAVNMLRKSPVLDRSLESKEQQWRIILVFLELYTFVIKVMDDEEFLSGSSESSASQSWTRQSALPLNQIKDLTVFLKNLAFSLYWNVAEIAGIEATEMKKTSLAEYFGGGSSQAGEREELPAMKVEEMAVAGVSGMTLAYMKGMVTGLLRMIYERE